MCKDSLCVPLGNELLRRLSLEAGQRLMAEPDDRFGSVAAEKVGRGRDDPGNLPKTGLDGRGFRMLRQAVAMDLGDAGQLRHRYTHGLADPRGQEDTPGVGHIVEEGMEHDGILCALSALYAHSAHIFKERAGRRYQAPRRDRFNATGRANTESAKIT